MLHDPNVVEEFKETRKNLEIQEQKNSLFKKFRHFLNSMSPDRFIKFLMYMTAVENIETNNRYSIHLQKKLNTKFVLCPETHEFITEELFKRKATKAPKEADRKPTGDKLKLNSSGVKNEPKTKYQKNSEESEDFKKSKLHNVVKLDNPSGHNLCWLNSLAYMLISVDLVSVLAENLTSLQDIDEFSSLAQRFLVMITSGIYDQENRQTSQKQPWRN